VARGEKGLEKAPSTTLFEAADKAIEEDGYNVLILSDRGVSREMAPIPALLAVAGLHHHLIREGTRTRWGLVSNRANRARCITSRCSSVTAATRSIPTWPSRRWTT
jgi:hypothetical protein